MRQYMFEQWRWHVNNCMITPGTLIIRTMSDAKTNETTRLFWYRRENKRRILNIKQTIDINKIMILAKRHKIQDRSHEILCNELRHDHNDKLVSLDNIIIK